LYIAGHAGRDRTGLGDRVLTQFRRPFSGKLRIEEYPRDAADRDRDQEEYRE
jgi:hypothetical protein